jgi:hypothetical protein
MGDWCDSRNHTMKRRARKPFCKMEVMAAQQIFIAVIRECFFALLTLGGLMGAPMFHKPLDEIVLPIIPEPDNEQDSRL